MIQILDDAIREANQKDDITVTALDYDEEALSDLSITVFKLQGRRMSMPTIGISD